MELTKDVFVQQRGDGFFLVYSPLSGKASIVNEAVLCMLKYYSLSGFELIPENDKLILVEAGLLTEREVIVPSAVSTNFKPVDITLFPTNDCNLRCTYCYANAGENDVCNMDISLGELAVELIVANALEMNKKKVKVGFHGGGEPTKNWIFLKQITEYGKTLCDRNGLNMATSIVTNGILNDKQIEWIIKNITRVSISFDGPRDIQNLNRPLAGGKESFEHVYRTVKHLRDANYDFGVRATITEQTVSRMEEIFDFFVELGIKSIHFEPLFKCGRCSKSQINSPSPEIFAENYIALKIKAKETDIRLVNSMGKLNKIATSFCGAAGNNFCITPEGCSDPIKLDTKGALGYQHFE